MKTKQTNFDRYLNELFKDPKRKERYEKELNRLLLAERIIEVRKKKKMSQIELARRVGMKQPAIARLESGRENPRYETVARIFGALGEKQIPV